MKEEGKEEKRGEGELEELNAGERSKGSHGCSFSRSPNLERVLGKWDKDSREFICMERWGKLHMALNFTVV